MFEKWVTRFREGCREQGGAAEAQHLPVSAAGAVRRTSLLEHLEQQERSGDRLMESILEFRRKTHSLDYLRHELERLSTKDGESELLKRFAETMQAK